MTVSYDVYSEAIIYFGLKKLCTFGFATCALEPSRELPLPLAFGFIAAASISASALSSSPISSSLNCQMLRLMYKDQWNALTSSKVSAFVSFVFRGLSAGAMSMSSFLLL